MRRTYALAPVASALLEHQRRQRAVAASNQAVKIISLALSLVCIAASWPAQADVQSLAAIQASAESYVREHLPAVDRKHFVSANRLDERLRLQACASPLETFTTASAPIGSRSTIGVRCSAPVQWTLYVPVSVEVEVPVLVLRRALARRARVTQADVEPQIRRLPGLATQFIDDVTALQGHRLKRSLPAGTALTVDVLAPDILVRRGQQVTLIAAHGPVEIRAQGLAISEGGASDRIRVQNVNSLKVVEGIVESESIVRVGT